MYDAQFVDVFNTRNQLLIHLCSFFFFQPPVFYDVLEQLTTRAVLHDEVEVVLVLYHLVELDDVRVSHLLEDRDLSIDSVDVRLIFNFIFF